MPPSDDPYFPEEEAFWLAVAAVARGRGTVIRVQTVVMPDDPSFTRVSTVDIRLRVTDMAMPDNMAVRLEAIRRFMTDRVPSPPPAVIPEPAPLPPPPEPPAPEPRDDDAATRFSLLELDL